MLFCGYIVIYIFNNGKMKTKISTKIVNTIFLAPIEANKFYET